MAGVEEERHGGEKEGKRRGAARGAGAWQGLLHGAWGCLPARHLASELGCWQPLLSGRRSCPLERPPAPCVLLVRRADPMLLTCP